MLLKQVMVSLLSSISVDDQTVATFADDPDEDSIENK
jgi:hypothetical protein